MKLLEDKRLKVLLLKNKCPYCTCEEPEDDCVGRIPPRPTCLTCGKPIKAKQCG